MWPIKLFLTCCFFHFKECPRTVYFLCNHQHLISVVGQTQVRVLPPADKLKIKLLLCQMAGCFTIFIFFQFFNPCDIHIPILWYKHRLCNIMYFISFGRVYSFYCCQREGIHYALRNSPMDTAIKKLSCLISKFHCSLFVHSFIQLFQHFSLKKS